MNWPDVQRKATEAVKLFRRGVGDSFVEFSDQQMIRQYDRLMDLLSSHGNPDDPEIARAAREILAQDPLLIVTAVTGVVAEALIDRAKARITESN